MGLVVYHLHAWANRSVLEVWAYKWYPDFRIGKFLPRIAFTICTNQFHLLESHCEGLKRVSKLKMALKKRNTNLRWNIPSGKTGLHFRMFRCSWKFSAGTVQKVLFHLLSDRILRKLFVNGKKPLSYSKSRFPLKYCAGIEYVILIIHRVKKLNHWIMKF